MSDEPTLIYVVIAAGIVFAGLIWMFMRSRRRDEADAAAAATRGWQYERLPGGTVRLQGQSSSGQPWLLETTGGKAPWTVWRCDKVAMPEGALLISPRRKAFGMDLGSSLTRVLAMNLGIPLPDVREMEAGGESFQKYFRVYASDKEKMRPFFSTHMETLLTQFAEQHAKGLKEPPVLVLEKSGLHLGTNGLPKDFAMMERLVALGESLLDTRA
jgi:hypothetical protein